MRVTQVFFRTGTRIPPDEARRKVALLMDKTQPGLMAMLMNYEAGSEKSITGFPPVQFASTFDGFGLLGFGDTGQAVVADAVPLIHKALSKDSGDIVQVDSNDRAVTVEKRPYAIQYRVPRMVVQKKRHHLTAMDDPVAGKKHVETLLASSLRRQAEALGIQLPDGITVEFLGASGTFATKNSATGHHCLGLKNAMFAVNLRLGGIWSVGFLLSKGYGHFNGDHQLGGEGGS